MVVFGGILLILGFRLREESKYLPPDISPVSGLEFESFEAFWYKLLGSTLIFLGIFTIMSLIFLTRLIVKGPKDFYRENKRLYYNYLLCTDLDKDRKEYYKLKIQEMVNLERSHDTSGEITTAIGAATLFNMINKK